MTIAFARLAAVTAVLAAAITPVRAATFDVALTGHIADGVFGKFLGDDIYYLQLSPITPFTVAQGDIVHATITLDKPFQVRGSTQSLVCVDIEHGCSFLDPNFNPPPGPLGSDSTLVVGNSTGPTGLPNDTLHIGCGCITALMSAPANTPFSFDSLIATINIGTLPTPYTVDAISFSYQLNPVATPEPASMILFGLTVGATGLVAGNHRKR